MFSHEFSDEFEKFVEDDGFIFFNKFDHVEVRHQFIEMIVPFQLSARHFAYLPREYAMEFFSRFI